MRRLLGARGGFSLVELVIAMLLSSFVMIGIVGVASQMVRFQVEGMRKGSVTGWSLVAITAMNKEIEDATVLAYPTNATGPQNAMVACKNYSRVTNLALSAGEPIITFGYCYDPDGIGYLRRWETTGTCPGAVGVPPSPCSSVAEVVATGVHLDAAGNNVFRRADDVGGIQIRYRVGDPTPTPNMPMPQTMAFDMKFAMNKQYNNDKD